MHGSDEAMHRLRTIDQFTRQAPSYAAIHGHDHEEALELLLRATDVTADDSALDVACGAGQAVFAFAARAGRATGIDITPAMIERAKALQRERNIENVRWQVGDASNLPFPGDAFSVVTCRHALHHVLDPLAVAREMTRVCRPGGRVALVDVAPTPETAPAFNALEKLRDPSHVRALTLEELLELARNSGLSQVQHASYGVTIALDALLESSFPEPANEEIVRRLLTESIGENNLGAVVSQNDAGLQVTYPIALIVGRVPARRGIGMLE